MSENNFMKTINKLGKLQKEYVSLLRSLPHSGKQADEDYEMQRIPLEEVENETERLKIKIENLKNNVKE